MKNLITYIIFLIVAAGCEYDSKNVLFDVQEQEVSPFVGDWVSEGGRMYSSRLIIKEDSTFSFTYGACLMDGFSFGEWAVYGEGIILNSLIDSTECWFATDFLAQHEILPNDSIVELEIKTTIDGCEPQLREEEYVLFEDEHFNLSNDTLIHLNSLEADFFDPDSHYRFTKLQE